MSSGSGGDLERAVVRTARRCMLKIYWVHRCYKLPDYRPVMSPCVPRLFGSKTAGGLPEPLQCSTRTWVLWLPRVSPSPTQNAHNGRSPRVAMGVEDHGPSQGQHREDTPEGPRSEGRSRPGLHWDRALANRNPQSLRRA